MYVFIYSFPPSKVGAASVSQPSAWAMAAAVPPSDVNPPAPAQSLEPEMKRTRPSVVPLQGEPRQPGMQPACSPQGYVLKLDTKGYLQLSQAGRQR
jgi:hypothetical protein